MNFLFFLSVLIFSTYANAVSLSTINIYEISKIKNENVDMWDKKNDAIKNAKKKATLRLAAKVLKPEVFKEAKKRLEKKVVPYSSRYLISFVVKSHGVEESGDFKAYYVNIEFKYSLKNLRNFLKDKGFQINDLKKHKVIAFVEILDATVVKSYRWWRDENLDLHPVIMPFQIKLLESLKEEGYELIPIQILKAFDGFKSTASQMGAQYYIKGSLRIKRKDNMYKVNSGSFNFYQTLSQKLVSTIDLKKIGYLLGEKEDKENINVKPKELEDLLKKAFVGAAKKMKASENVDHLNFGLTQISFQGVNSPLQLKNIKAVIRSGLKDNISSLVERHIQNGKVVFYARTTLTPQRLLSVMNSRVFGLGTYKGALKEDGKSLLFRVAQ